ncbi:MAG: CopD family protein [Anaerolineae bacterium]|nr:CopD family protein [Anaerolineae bacterium]
MRRIIFIWISLTLALLSSLATPVLPASAHGYIVRSIPDDRAVLERAPARLQYWFSENLEPEFSKLTVRDQAGSTVAEGGVDPGNLALLAVRLPSDLPDGAYVAELRTAFASDGHVIVETRVFFVGEAAGAVAGESSGQASATLMLEVVWRVLALSSAVLLLGTFSVYAMVLVPAWGSSKYPAGLLPPRVMTRLNWIVGVALAVAFAGNILALLQQSMVFFDADLGRVISGQLYNVVRIGTTFGDTWNVRMILLVLVGGLFAASFYFRQNQPETVRAFWVANIWGMALLMGTFSVGSHAAGSLLLPWLAILSDWLHGMAVGFWAGGAAALALVVPVALQPYSGDARRQALLIALRRFTRIATAGLVVVIATGIYSALNWFTAPADVVSSYGGALLLKLILVALLITVGAAHHVAIDPARYQRWSAAAARVSDFIPTLRLEALLVLLVVVSVGYLSATPIPQPEIAGETAPPPSASQTVGDTTVTTTITPGGPGINTYDVQVEQGGAALENQNVVFRMIEPARDYRGEWHDLESTGGGLYTSVGDDIARPGEWWTVVEVNGTRAVFDWDISAAASVIQSRDPTLLNALALLGVVGALVYAASPLLRRFYHALDLSPAALTVAVGSTAVTVVIVVVGVWLSAQAGEEAQLIGNPIPAVVNTSLPTSESLARGQALYESACAAWQGAPDADELVKRLPRLRDEDLYAAVTRDGWWTLPPCSGDAGESQWWDVVNYLRSLETISISG